MTKEELHVFLTTHFDLVPDSLDRGLSRSYFLGQVVWHPSSSTRILHVQYGALDQVTHIKRCISSDNNNSVFVPLPVSWQVLREAVAEEMAQHTKQK